MTFWQKLVATLLYYISTAYCLTWRYKYKNRNVYTDLVKRGKRPVMALWHDQLLLSSFAHRKEGVVTIASDSKDGELITFALTKWGYNVSRGSSTRGGVKAALNAIKTSKKLNVPCAVTVDGPKGPRHTVKNGAIFIAERLDGIIIVALAHTKRFIKFNSWDKFILPLPFASIEITYSEPIIIGKDAENPQTQQENLQKIMTELTNEASPLFI